MASEDDRTPGAPSPVIDRFVGGRLRQCRDGLGLTSRAFAGRLGVTPHLLRRYEAGVRPVPATVLVRAAAVCDCPPEAFFPLPAGAAARRVDVTDDSETRLLTRLFVACPPSLRRRILSVARAIAEH